MHTRQRREGESVRPQRYQPRSLWSQKAAQKQTRLVSLSSNDASRTFLLFAPEITNLPTRSGRLLAGTLLHVSLRYFQKNIRVFLGGRQVCWTRGLHSGQAQCPMQPYLLSSPAHQESPLKTGKALKNPR